MQYACSAVADLANQLKHQFQRVLSTSPGYGRDKAITLEIDRLGMLIQELGDAVVVMQIRIDEQAAQPGSEPQFETVGSREP